MVSKQRARDVANMERRIDGLGGHNIVMMNREERHARLHELMQKFIATRDVADRKEMVEHADRLRANGWTMADEMELRGPLGASRSEMSSEEARRVLRGHVIVRLARMGAEEAEHYVQAACSQNQQLEQGGE